MKATATTVHQLIQGSKVFVIPAFQRRYTWKRDQWDALWSDVLNQYDIEHPQDPETLHGHFLGSVVLHPAPGPASTLMRHQVIDGQQRLTTILILLAALRDVRASFDAGWNPAAIDSQYLSNPFSPDYPDRLIPTLLDRHDFVSTISAGEPSGEIGVAYIYFRDAIKESADSASIDFDRLQETILLHLLVVEINTKLGDSVNGIFNTLNSKGLELSQADLVRNEILHHLGEASGEEAHRDLWIPMESNLVSPGLKNSDREFVTFLWSREVAIDPKITRDRLFGAFESRLREQLKPMSPAQRELHSLEVLREMSHDHRLFLLIRDPTNNSLQVGISSNLHSALRDLYRWRSEPSTPIALWLVKQAAAGLIEQDDAAAAIRTLLSFLVRRILHGTATNQLNRLLTPVAHDLARRPAGVSVVDQMRALLSRPGYQWPTDREVLQQVISNPLYARARRYVKFLLEVVERSLPGSETADLERAQIEHVMPQQRDRDWDEDLIDSGMDPADADAYVHTLGNLTLTENNQAMGNASFRVKRDQFYSASALRLNRHLGELEKFLPAEIQDRSRKLAELVLAAYSIGPEPTSSSNGAAAARVDRGRQLKELLQSVPVESWVWEGDFEALLGAGADDVRRLVGDLDASLVRLVRDENGVLPAWLPDSIRSRVAAQLDDRETSWRRLKSEELRSLLERIDGRDEVDADGDDS